MTLYFSEFMEGVNNIWFVWVYIGWMVWTHRCISKGKEYHNMHFIHICKQICSNIIPISF